MYEAVWRENRHPIALAERRSVGLELETGQAYRFGGACRELERMEVVLMTVTAARLERPANIKPTTPVSSFRTA